MPALLAWSAEIAEEATAEAAASLPLTCWSTMMSIQRVEGNRPLVHQRASDRRRHQLAQPPNAADEQFVDHRQEHRLAIHALMDDEATADVVLLVHSGITDGIAPPGAGQTDDPPAAEDDERRRLAGKKVLYHCHRCLLAARSSYFRQLLFQAAALRNQPTGRRIELPSAVTAVAFGAIREYIYTGRCVVTTDNMVELVAACCVCELPELLEECALFAVDALALSNVCHTFATADLYAAEMHSGGGDGDGDGSRGWPVRLKHCCRQWIHANAPAVLDTEGFLHLKPSLVAELAQADELAVDELTLFRAVCRWVRRPPKLLRARSCSR